MMDNIGLQRVFLKKLNAKIVNAVIVGIIIRTQNVRIFSGKDKSPQRGVWNFTLRESITDYINVTCWGSEEYIVNMGKKFTTGDVVDVIRPRIQIRSVDDSNEQLYRPAVTSPYSLVLNENQSTVIIHEGDNYHQFLPLLHYPTKPTSSYLTLADVYNNGDKFQGEFVNLLVAIQGVTAKKMFKRKNDGKPLHKRDIVVLDQSQAGLKITLWDDEFIRRADQWEQQETILFMSDMRVEWSNFERCTVAVANSRTVITEDPITPQAEALKKYIRENPMPFTSPADYMTAKIPNPNTINVIMTVQQVLHTAMQMQSNSNNPGLARNDNQFTALMYVIVTDFDLDGFTEVVRIRCDRCNQRIDKSLNECENLECPVGTKSEQGSPEYKFDIPLNLSDHTGTLDKCRLSGPIAENILGTQVQDFLKMNAEEKEKLKWKFLMERCKVRLVIVKQEDNWPLITILSCELADPGEVAVKLPVF